VASKSQPSQPTPPLPPGQHKAPYYPVEPGAQPKRGDEPLRQVRLVIATISAMAWTALPDGSVDYVNDRWLEYIGQSRDEFERRGWIPLVHPDDLERTEAYWRATIAAGRQSEFEHRVRRANGEYRWIRPRCVPLRDENGTIVKWYGSVVDIDERKRALQEAPALKLSLREDEVLRLVVEGRTSKEIAAIVGVKPSTIDTYRSRIMAKLGINDVPSLVRFAIRRGVIKL
jgi:PAS domain S-box-containing protein